MTAFLVIGIAVLFALTPQASAINFEHTTSFGRFGTTDGLFKSPNGIAVNSENIFVVDSVNTRIQIFTLVGGYVNQFGSSGTGNGQFSSPAGIAVNDTHIFVVDKGNSRIQIFTLDGAYVNQFGSSGDGNGELSNTAGIAINSTNIFVTDRGNDRVQIFTLLGAYVDQFGSSGNGDGQFSSPSGIAVNSENIFVVDSVNTRIQIFDIDTYLYQGQFGTRGTGDGQFSSPQGIAVNDTHIFVVDNNNSNVQLFTLAGVYVDQFGSSGNGDGQFNIPNDIAISDTSIFTTEANTHRVQIFAIPSGLNPCPSGQIRNNGGTCVVDTEKPVIKVGGVVGDRTLSIISGHAYTELIGTVTDNDQNYVGNVDVVTTPSAITNTGVKGLYTVTYTARADASGNSPIPVEITVEIVCAEGLSFHESGTCIPYTPLTLPTLPENQVFRNSETVSLTLPRVSGGTDNSNHVYTATPLPAGLSFDPLTRMLTGTLTTAGTTTVNYRVGDTLVGNEDDLSVTATFTIVVGNYPVTAAIDDQIFTVDQAVSFTLPTGTGGTSPYRYTLTGVGGVQLPTGLVHNTDVTPQTITGTPTVLTPSRSYIYKVTDSASLATEKTFAIRVDGPAPTSHHPVNKSLDGCGIWNGNEHHSYNHPSRWRIPCRSDNKTYCINWGWHRDPQH